MTIHLVQGGDDRSDVRVLNKRISGDNALLFDVDVDNLAEWFEQLPKFSHVHILAEQTRFIISY